jgi:hypothetical protein
LFDELRLIDADLDADLDADAEAGADADTIAFAPILADPPSSTLITVAGSTLRSTIVLSS